MTAPALNLATLNVGDAETGEILDGLINATINRLRPAASSYKTSPIKRGCRRTKAEMADIRAGLRRIVAAEQPMTVRQVFYQAVVEGLIETSEAEYQNTVARLLLEMRRAGEIPYAWVADNTRWMRKPTYTGLADFNERHQRAYRRDLWTEADSYIEIWLEKEALAGVVVDVTSEYDVPLMVSGGFASEAYLYSVADAITDQLVEGKQQAVIYYFGDYDPSGLHISNSIEQGLRRLCHSLCRGFEPEMLVFERVAVDEEQIKHWKLPTRPTKTKGNNHAKGSPDGRPSVELDAIPPGDLRNTPTPRNLISSGRSRLRSAGNWQCSASASTARHGYERAARAADGAFRANIAKGTVYLAGWLGKARLVGFKAKEPDKYGNDVWEVYAQEPEPRTDSPAPTRSAERGQKAWDRARDAQRPFHYDSAAAVADLEGRR